MSGLVLPFAMFAVFITGCACYLWFAGSDFNSGSGNFPLYIVISVMIPSMTAVLLYGVLRYINRVKIDDISIAYINVLSRREERYLLAELDGYTMTTGRSKGAEYQFLYPVKNGKKLKGISSIYYSNFEELKSALRISEIGKQQ